jgi:hypothetical protein
MAIERDSKGRFPKGHCPNPGGKTKLELEYLRGAIHRKPAAEALVTQALVAKLNEKVKDDPKGRTYAQCIAESLIRKAIMGDVTAAREITDRAEGKLPVNIPGEKPPEDQHEPDVHERLAELINQVKKNKPTPSLQ